MMGRRLSILLFCTLAFSMYAHAAPSVPSDFAYGRTVETEGQASLWQIRLPEDVYRKVIRPDLGDIRVFDASGQLVPHTLRRPEATIKEPPAPISLPIFPLYRSDEKESVGHSLRIITDDKGTIVNTIRESIPTDKKEVISTYLLDATKIQQNPDKLILDWESSKETGFSVNVNVDMSDDLSAWYRLGHNATLADLRFGEHQLSHHEINIPVRSYKYLRISWPIELREVTLKGVTAAFPSTELPPQRHWIQFTGAKNPELPISYDFDTNGYWPVDQARIIFPPQNILINGELASRPDEKFVWYRKYHGLFYKLLQDDGTMLMSPPVNFMTTNDRYWHIVEVGGGNALDRYTPVLELGWTPHILTFVAQGEPPYVIAYGSAAVGPLEQTMDPIMFGIHQTEQQVQIKTATTSPGYTLGGIDKLEPPPEPLPWRKWLLWFVLITGVVLLAWMVWRLSRQLGESPKSQN